MPEIVGFNVMRGQNRSSEPTTLKLYGALLTVEWKESKVHVAAQLHRYPGNRRNEDSSVLRSCVSRSIVKTPPAIHLKTTTLTPTDVIASSSVQLTSDYR